MDNKSWRNAQHPDLAQATITCILIFVSLHLFPDFLRALYIELDLAIYLESQFEYFSAAVFQESKVQFCWISKPCSQLCPTFLTEYIPKCYVSYDPSRILFLHLSDRQCPWSWFFCYKSYIRLRVLNKIGIRFSCHSLTICDVLLPCNMIHTEYVRLESEYSTFDYCA